MADQPGESRDQGPEQDQEPEIFVPETDEASSALPPRIERWRKRSATGAMLTGLAFGLREALEPDRKDPSIVLETSGVPPKDLPVEAELEEGIPKNSVVKVRRWLLPDEESDIDPEELEAEALAAPVPDRVGEPTPTAIPGRGQRSTLAGRNRRPSPSRRKKK